MAHRPLGPDSAYQRGANYAEIYLADDAHRAPAEVEQLRRAVATHNTQELRIPHILDSLEASGHPDHPSVVDPEDDFWQGFLDRIRQQILR